MSEFLRLLENDIQLVALSFFGAVYVIRLIWLFRFQSQKERTFSAGNSSKGIAYSMFNVAMPWAMESTRKKPVFYAQFVIFHLGVTAAIAATFIIPYVPNIFENKLVVLAFQGILGAAFFVGISRLYRRFRKPQLRLISSPDDYFSLVLLIFYFASAVLAISNNYRSREWPLILFFGLTVLFLLYVPFSKICHYLYYPFTRFFMGRTMGHRGIVAKKKNLSSVVTKRRVES
jgi:nitrate reductase gamma subunit